PPRRGRGRPNDRFLRSGRRRRKAQAPTPRGRAAVEVSARAAFLFAALAVGAVASAVDENRIASLRSDVQALAPEEAALNARAWASSWIPVYGSVASLTHTRNAERAAERRVEAETRWIQAQEAP